jgi:hypothetical protein
MSTNVLILQLALLGVVLESDLGRKKAGWFRVLRPVIAVVLIVPFFFTSLPTERNDLLLQGAGALAGLLLGLACMSPWFVKIGYDPAWRSRVLRHRAPRGRVVTHAGFGYAGIWIAFTAARLWFAYGSQHEFPVQLGHFLTAHQLSADALTNAFIFMSIGMDLFRSVLLAARAQQVRRDHAGEPGRRAPVTATAGPAAAGSGPGAGSAAAPAGQPSPGRTWTSDLLSIPLLLAGSRLNRQVDRRDDRLDRRGRRGL